MYHIFPQIKTIFNICLKFFIRNNKKTHLTRNCVDEFSSLYGGGGGNRTRVRRGLHDSLYECSLGFSLGLSSSPGPDPDKPYPLVFPLCSRETSGKWVDGVVHARYTSADEGERTHRTRRREPNYLRQLMFESFDFFTSFRQLDSQLSVKHLPVETGTPPSFVGTPLPNSSSGTFTEKRTGTLPPNQL